MAIAPVNNNIPQVPVENEGNCCSNLIKKVAEVAIAIFTALVLVVYEILSGFCYVVSRITSGCINIAFNVLHIQNNEPAEQLEELKPEPLAEEAPIPAEAMKTRQTGALERLEVIQTGALEFTLNPKVIKFDLDAALDKYSKDHELQKFLELFNYANPGIGYAFGAKLDDFQYFLNKYSAQHGVYINDKEHNQGQELKDAMSRLFDLLNKKIERIKGNEPQEKALKQQIRQIILRLINANENCIDQVLAQLDHILIESIASENTAGNATPQEQLQFAAARILFQYKSNLITETCQNLFRNQDHQADLERMIKQRIAPLIGIETKLNDVGAYYNFFTEEDANRTQKVILRRYNNDASFLDGEEDRWKKLDERPLSYLNRELIKPEVYSPSSNLRINLVTWATKHFSLAEEENATVTKIIEAASEDKEMDFTMGGNFSKAGLLLLLEEAGIIQEVK